MSISFMLSETPISLPDIANPQTLIDYSMLDCILINFLKVFIKGLVKT
jgi:hypothetical protein